MRRLQDERMAAQWLLFFWVHGSTEWQHAADVVSFPGEELRDAVVISIVHTWGRYEPVTVAIWDADQKRWFGLFEGQRDEAVQRVQMAPEMAAVRG